MIRISALRGLGLIPGKRDWDFQYAEDGSIDGCFIQTPQECAELLGRMFKTSAKKTEFGYKLVDRSHRTIIVKKHKKYTVVEILPPNDIDLFNKVKKYMDGKGWSMGEVAETPDFYLVASHKKVVPSAWKAFEDIGKASKWSVHDKMGRHFLRKNSITVYYDKDANPQVTMLALK